MSQIHSNGAQPVEVLGQIVPPDASAVTIPAERSPEELANDALSLSHTDEPGHIVNDIIIRFAGDGGEGVITSGEFFSLVCGRIGLEIFKTTSLPAEIKG